MTKSNFDTPWKMILERYLPSVFEFLLPNVAQKIDWTHPYQCLDKELLALQKESKIKTRLADKLIEVMKKDGQKAFVLIHLEIQGAQDKDFAERMYRYYYRIDDRYKKPLMSIAILTDQNPKWRPNCYSSELWGCELTLSYPIIKLIDFQDKLDILAHSTNPIAKVIEAHLAALNSQNNIQLRFDHKLRLVKNLYHLGYSKKEVLDLYSFIDYALNLGSEFESKFMADIHKYEAEVIMQPYITSAEKIGIEKGRKEGFEQGIEKGIEKGERKVLKLLLKQKFGNLAQSITDKIDHATEFELERWCAVILKANKIDDLFS